MHKAGSTEGPMQLNSQLRTFMKWMTSTILPALLHKHPLSDLNVSQIAAAESPMKPVSPLPSEPPRRRSNRNKTPSSNRFSSSFSLQSFTHNYDHVSAYSRAVAVILVKLGCIMMSEWLAAGGGESKEIVLEVAKWTPALRQHTFDLDIRSELLPVFGRLVFQIAKASGDCSLLKELLTSCSNIEPGSADETKVQEVVLSLLACHRSESGGSPRETAVSAVLEAAVAAAASSFDNPDSSFADDEDGSILVNSSAINVALLSVMSNGPASVLLAKLISQNLSERGSIDIEDRKFIFQEKCMKKLLDKTSKTGKLGTEVRSICSKILGKQCSEATEGDAEDKTCSTEITAN